jgi:hypothetical protein
MNNEKPSTYEQNGFTNFQDLGNSVITQLVDRGFDVVYPTTGVNSSTFKATLKPRIPDSINTFTPDQLAATQPWYLHIDCDGTPSTQDPGFLRIYASHPLQMIESADGGGDVAEARSFNGATPGDVRSYSLKSGEMTNGWYNIATGSHTGPSGIGITKVGQLTVPFASKFWGNHSVNEAPLSDNGAKTYSYRLTVSNQGIALVVWEEGEDMYGSHFSWFVVQRPVLQTGEVLTVGKCPVFCIYSVGGGEPQDPTLVNSLADVNDPLTRTHANYDDNPAIYMFTVRESDVYRPSVPALASVDSPDHHAVINAKQQVAITENNKYVISFPHNLNTQRYMYREEIDLITYTSADVISQYSNVAVSVYGEAVEREYKAMHANLPNNAGMRILILTNGPGF